MKRALEKFIEPEMLDGVNRYLCFKFVLLLVIFYGSQFYCKCVTFFRCKQKVPAQKTLTIHRAPNVLTLQMKRLCCV